MLKTKTILITGADGFIGSHLTKAVVKKRKGQSAVAFKFFQQLGMDCSENLQDYSPLAKGDTGGC